MRQINRYQALLFMLFCLMIAATLRFPELSLTPPGVHYDEAANGVLSAEIGLDGARPVFITSYTGKEVFFFYLAGGLMQLLGDSIFALRATSAFIGVLTVAATYWLGMELFRDRRIALLAAALLAVSFWHLLFSRLGFRAITQPLLQALALAALLRGYRLNRWPWLIAGGILLGLTAYTYLAARLFPLLLGFALLPLLLSRPQRLLRWGQTVVVGLTAFVVALPLLNFFRVHPDAFWVRISQVGPDAEAISLGRSLAQSLGMIFLQGDPYWRFNLPGRPLFDWFWGGLLLVGWIFMVVRWRHVSNDWERCGRLLLILSPLIMILPTALASNEILPSNLRAIGLIPFIFYLPASGLMILLDDLYRRFARPSPTVTALVVSVLVLIVGGIYVEGLYFRAWALQPDLFLETDADLTTAADFLNDIDTADQTIYVAARHYQHPTLAFLSDKYDEVKWLPQSEAVAFPAEGPAVYIYPDNSSVPVWAAGYFPEAATIGLNGAVDSERPFKAFRLDTPPPLTYTHAVAANFGQTITLLGYDVGAGHPDGTLPVTLFWHIQQETDADFAPFVHLDDQWGQRWSQIETFAYPAAQWTPGETVVQRVELPVPAGTPPGEYRLRVGLFSAASGEQIPVLDEAGRYAGNAAFLNGNVMVAEDLPATLPQPPNSLDEEVRPHLRLFGFDSAGSDVATGEPYAVGLWWLASRPIVETVAQFALTRPSGDSIVLAETQPVHNSYPFSEWQTPVFIIDRHTLVVPESTPAGEYQLQVRFLDEGTLLAEANLGTLQVTASQRQFEAPAFETAVDATFGDEITLLGYSLNPTVEPGGYSLSLVWQADQLAATDYTVFVHLLAPDGRCEPCVWQADLMPRQGEYPTSRWLAGEVVVDSYQITLPEAAEPAPYPLEVGLYVAATGQRLQTATADGRTGDALLLEPVVVE